jgi:acyl carrier protein
MTRNEFLTELQDILQCDYTLDPSMTLLDLPEWDSLSMLAVAALFDERFTMTLTFENFRTFLTINDLLVKAGIT